MKLVFYSPILNHHQAPVADELHELLGGAYAFVETVNCRDNKGFDGRLHDQTILNPVMENKR